MAKNKNNEPKLKSKDKRKRTSPFPLDSLPQFMRRHIQFLCLDSVEEYLDWCRQHGMPCRIYKTWEQAHRERQHANRMRTEARVREVRFLRRPQRLLRQMLDGQIAPTNMPAAFEPLQTLLTDDGGDIPTPSAQLGAQQLGLPRADPSLLEIARNRGRHRSTGQRRRWPILWLPPHPMQIPHQFADRIIREALHDPKNLRDLLEMVLGEVASRFDYDSVVYEDPEFHLPNLQRREADLLCRIKFRTGKGSVETIVCVLIEHQSAEDNSMPLRMLLYAALEWFRLWKQGPDSRTATVPAILPIVFHTGEGPWQTHRDLGDIIESPDPLPTVAPLWPILYVDLDAYSTDELLESSSAWRQSLAVVKAEREQSVAKYSKVVGASAAGIDKLADTDIERHWCLLEFILQWVTARRLDEQLEALYHAVLRHVRPEHREEIISMSSKMRLTLEEAAEKRAEERGKERYELGKAEGKAEGKLENCRILLCKLLEKRFGPLTDNLRRQIDASDDIQRLQTCVEQASDISSPDELAI